MNANVIFVIFFGISVFSFQNIFSQLRHPWELLMHTQNGPDEITFHIISTSAYVWEPHQSTINYTCLTTENKYVDPEDMTMPGNYSGDGHGWNSANWPYNQSPFLGRGFYKITVEGKSATLKVDCYGTILNTLA